MTAIQHPATMPAGTIGFLDRSVHRVGVALVRWSTHRAERDAAHRAAVMTTVLAPDLRRAVLADRAARELSAARAAACLAPIR